MPRHLDINIDKYKTAYLLVCTGRYKELFAGFYESFRKHFDEDLFVLTEDTRYFSKYRVTALPIEHISWPGVVMKKFSNILRYRDVFGRYGKIICLQSNMRFVKPLKLQFDNLLFCFHPYCRNDDYICGGFVGGTVDAFLELCRDCDTWLAEHPSATWHDETALNWYWNNNRDKGIVLPKETIYKEGDYDRSLHPTAAIVVLNKDKFFGTSKKEYAS